MSKSTTSFWNSQAQQLLVGHKIVSARYLTQTEADDHDWTRRPIVLELDNGILLYPSSDNEGNGAGSLFVFPDTPELNQFPSI